ncbi:hypothetical protein ECC31_00485 [Helicobacter pylori]|nr:hypothetical protein ECC31_00485 [Helicobacter pylori]
MFEWGIAIKKGFFNFGCLVWLFEICYKKDFFFGFVCKFCCNNDFLKEIKRFCDHFPQKLKGF